MKIEVKYKIDSKGKIRVWKCWADQDENGHWGVLSQDGLLNGKIKDPVFKKAVAKNIGKANELNTRAQAFMMVKMLVAKKEKNNYFDSVSKAQSGKKFKPMLAHKWEKYNHEARFPLLGQPKLDGARCNIYYCPIEGKVVARSRTTKNYSEVVNHIVEEWSDFLAENRYIILDGELYNHKLHNNFEKIMSLVRKSKPTQEEIEEAAELVEFHIYDIASTKHQLDHFSRRNSDLQNYFDIVKPTHSVYVDTYILENNDSLETAEKALIENGYEGIMVRTIKGIYKIDGRSRDLLKKKLFIDEEFEILDILPGSGAWSDAAKNIILKLNDGSTQGCGINGTMEMNQKRLKNKELLIGKMATVRYFRTTKENKLYLPVCVDIDRHD